jgi:pyruvate formate lyase activating enzyme
MTDPQNTTPEMLIRAAEIGRQAGLRYIYAGNLPGMVETLENTYCPNCRAAVIERYGYLITGYHLTSSGTCPGCNTAIPGKWAPKFEGQITAHPFLPRRARSLSQFFRSA